MKKLIKMMNDTLTEHIIHKNSNILESVFDRLIELNEDKDSVLMKDFRTVIDEVKTSEDGLIKYLEFKRERDKK